MSSQGRSDIGGFGVEMIPVESKKMVDSLKEIVHCPEVEIYSALKDSNMDPNEAVNRLLSQDPFHQVKSKRDKKKENKDLPEIKFRVTSTLHRGPKSDRGRGGSAQYSCYDSSSFLGKPAYKKENGTNSHTTSLSLPQVALDNPSWRPSALSKSVSKENQSKRRVVGAISASPPDPSYQSVSVGVPGKKSDLPYEEVKDGVATSILSETTKLQHLSIQEEERKPSYEEDGPSVVIPDHLQVQSADCSYLSFGSFRSNLVIGFSGSTSSRNNIEEAPIVADASVIGKTDLRKAEYYDEDAILSESDEILAHRANRVAGTFDSADTAQSGFLKEEYPEAVAAHGSQYNFSTESTEYPFQVAQHNTAFGYTQKSSWMQNLPISNEMVYTNPFSSTLLAEKVSLRDSEFTYSPFPVSQSAASKYGNTSSTNGSSLSLEEALQAGLQSLHPTQQHLSGKRVASEQSDPQHLAAHQNSEPSHPFGPFANMKGYSYVPQDETYMPSAFPQTFVGNGTYHQSPAAVLPQYKNSASVSSFPQSATVPAGYGNFGDSSTIPGNYSSPTVVPAGSTIGYDDLLSTQYKDSSYSIPPQKNENSAMWLRGDGSRTMSAVPANTYYSFHGQNQHPGGFAQGQQSSLNYGDTDFYNPQTGMPYEQPLQSHRSGSVGGSYAQTKQQSHQIWQNSY